MWSKVNLNFQSKQNEIQFKNNLEKKNLVIYSKCCENILFTFHLYKIVLSEKNDKNK